MTYSLEFGSLAPDVPSLRSDYSLPPKTPFTLWTNFNLSKVEVQNADPLVPTSRLFASSRVKHALSRLNISVYSHLVLSDRVVSDHFRPDCLLFRKPDGRYRSCIFSSSFKPSLIRHYKEYNKCEKEKSSTSFSFQVEEVERHGGKHIVLILTLLRGLGPLLKGSPEASWTCHVLDATKIYLLPHVYREWVDMMIQERKSAGGMKKVERPSKSDQIREFIRAAFSNRKSIDFVEDPSHMQDFHLHHKYKYHIDLDAVLKQSDPPTRAETGENSRKDVAPEGQATPPYAEMGGAVIQR